jgi:hypothetical protein
MGTVIPYAGDGEIEYHFSENIYHFFMKFADGSSFELAIPS